VASAEKRSIHKDYRLVQVLTRSVNHTDGNAPASTRPEGNSGIEDGERWSGIFGTASKYVSPAELNLERLCLCECGRANRQQRREQQHPLHHTVLLDGNCVKGPEISSQLPFGCYTLADDR
jgi:hypothetical protein